jgi:hypothetical protein
MASRHLISYGLFVLAALVVVLTLTSLLAIGRFGGPLLALILLLVGFIEYRRGR